MKRFLAGISAAAIGTAGSVIVAVAAATPAGAATTCAGVVTQSQVAPPPGYTQVINAVMTVRNDEDTGLIGYWALDNYTKHIQVWANPSGSQFYVAAFYHGTWQTFAGAQSPDSGVTEVADGTGSISGGYVGTMTGAMLNSPTEPTMGTVGIYNFGGTESDILLGSYGNGQTGATNATDWLSFYFTPSTIATFSFGDGGAEWGWQYTGNSVSGPWCNTGAGTSGDIVTH